MSHKLSRLQSVVLGLAVLASVGLGGAGLVAVAAKQGLWAETFEVAVGFPEVHDVTPGTPVRVRGVDAGQVVAVEYPDHDGPDAAVTLRLRLDAKYRGRLFADAAAHVQSTGLLGSKVVAVSPGTPAAGPLAGGTLRAAKATDMAAAAEKLVAVADEADKLLKGVRAGTGTLGKLATDDELYDEVRGLVRDLRGVTAKADQEVAHVGGLVKDGRETLQSVQRVTDGFERSRLGRQFIDSPTALLVRPDCRREAYTYPAAALFEPGTAILTPDGHGHLDRLADLLRRLNADPAYARSEIVVAARCDPADPTQTPASAAELTRKQAEAAVEFLKAERAHKMGWFSRRKVTPVGLGSGPSPVVEAEPPPPSHLQVLLFTPQ